jgi:CRISPR-associated protein Cmr4
MKHPHFFQIRTISNLHIGSGEGDFSMIDKQVQRDVTTQLPTMHASGIKGALREAMEGHTDLVAIFGSEAGDTKNQQQGQYRFGDGNLLALPIRSSHDFYYLATCPMVLNHLISNMEQFGLTVPSELKTLAEITPTQGLAKYFGEDKKTKVRLEEITAEYATQDVSELKDLLGSRIALLHNDDFKALANDLPIIARNYLKDGISANLWYEEVVPREAVFYCMVTMPQDNESLNIWLKSKNHIVQIGANSTVGYGLCTFKPL